MRKVTSKTITPEQIEEVNECFGFEEGARDLSDAGYAFYYNQYFNNGLDVCDADRYANLNTILGYDVGIRKFRCLDRWLWENDYEIMEMSGSKEDKELLQEATKKTRTKELDYSKWTDFGKNHYTYSFFENGICYK